jgi:hypothetical protein
VLPDRSSQLSRKPRGPSASMCASASTHAVSTANAERARCGAHSSSTSPRPFIRQSRVRPRCDTQTVQQHNDGLVAARQNAVSTAAKRPTQAPLTNVSASYEHVRSSSARRCRSCTRQTRSHRSCPRLRDGSDVRSATKAHTKCAHSRQAPDLRVCEDERQQM